MIVGYDHNDPDSRTQIPKPLFSRALRSVAIRIRPEPARRVTNDDGGDAKCAAQEQRADGVGATSGGSDGTKNWKKCTIGTSGDAGVIDH